MGLGRGHMELGKPRATCRGRPDPADPELRAVPHRRESPLAERYGNKVPTAEEARWIASVRAAPTSPAARGRRSRRRSTATRSRFPPSASAAALLEPMGRSAAIWDSINGIRHAVPDPRRRVHVGRLHERVQPAGGLGGAHPSGLLAGLQPVSCRNNGCADIVIPVLHWLEVNTGRVSQGAGGIFGAGSAAWSRWAIASTTRLPSSAVQGHGRGVEQPRP